MYKRAVRLVLLALLVVVMPLEALPASDRAAAGAAAVAYATSHHIVGASVQSCTVKDNWALCFVSQGEGVGDYVLEKVGSVWTVKGVGGGVINASILITNFKVPPKTAKALSGGP